MEDGDSYKNLEKNIFRKPIRKIFDVGNVLQPFWVRCRSILSLYNNREFMVRKLNLVLYIGVIFWSLFLFSKII